jgi:uncharacterized protein (TIGR02145 family)
MCHNLGADENADPFTPSYSLNGAYYKWGSKEFTGGENDGIIAGPDASGVDPVSSSGNYSWSWFGGHNPSAYYGDNTEGMDVRVKSSFDPCPAGYRIPSYTEWQGLINYSGSRTWISANSTAGYQFGGALFLPAAGYRGLIPTAVLGLRSISGYYWSTRKDGINDAYNLNFINGTVNANDLEVRGHGLSVRCIAQ